LIAAATPSHVVLLRGINWPSGLARKSAVVRRRARGRALRDGTQHDDHLEPLVRAIEGAGGRVRAYGRDARKEEQMVALVDRLRRIAGCPVLRSQSRRRLIMARRH